MELKDAIIAILAILAPTCAILFGYVGFYRNRKKDELEEGKKNGMVMTELGYIKSGIDDIKTRQDKLTEQHIEVVTRLTAVEESAKQAHKRIDSVSARLDRKKGE